MTASDPRELQEMVDDLRHALEATGERLATVEERLRRHIIESHGDGKNDTCTCRHCKASRRVLDATTVRRGVTA